MGTECPKMAESHVAISILVICSAKKMSQLFKPTEPGLERCFVSSTGVGINEETIILYSSKNFHRPFPNQGKTQNRIR